jgi:hypothetical protein
MDRLMEKLMISKAIMDKSDSIKKTGNGGLPPTSLQQFDAPEAKFNIPQEFMSEMKSPSGLPADRQMKVHTIEAIKNSKLPDAIKKAMISSVSTKSFENSKVHERFGLLQVSRLCSLPEKTSSTMVLNSTSDVYALL